MSTAITIARREFRSLFLTPAAWIVSALFLLATGIVFVQQVLRPGAPATMRAVFGFGAVVLMFACPAITMKSLAEERRTGTWEALVSCPVGPWSIVLGKYLAAMGFLLLLLLPTLIHVAVLELYGRPDYGEIACGYLGMLLIGSAYLASGLLASALTNSQTIAFMLAIFFWLVIGIARMALPEYVDARWASVLFAADPYLRARDFSIGLVGTADVVYFVTIVFVFLSLAVRSVSIRRVW